MTAPERQRKDDTAPVAGQNTGLASGASGVPFAWTKNEQAFPLERSVLDFFQSAVRTQPESIAASHCGRLMTYAELDRISHRVAGTLRQRGLELEESVVILSSASCEFLAGVLGVLKAGGTYFPVDPGTPDKRLEFLLGDTGSRFVLTDDPGRQSLQAWTETVLDLAEFTQAASPATEENFSAPADPTRRAYITYTSGSTGQPKGVQIEHHALTNLVCFYHQRLGLSAADRATMLSYVAFDASVGDIWPTLCAGGTLVMPPKGILLNPDKLIQWLADEKITLAFVPTGLAEILFVRPWPKAMKLRFLITGGDRLRFRPPAGLTFEVINGYGPTENTVFSTWSVVAPEDGRGEPPPIGRPIANTTAYVLDESLRFVPVGVPGELYLGGQQIARGYLRRPELNAEKFLPDPFSGKLGARMYRTGDWVNWRADGELDFIGRKDGQIQIRGRRVELGEIEATLFTRGHLRQVCCVPLLDEGMPSGIVAHVVPENPAPGLAGELREYLRERLPDYMVPSEIRLHESLPLTVQGKLDRAALIAQSSAPQSAPDRAGNDGLEQALARLWHGLLPTAASSPPEATFAVLGGDSLLAIKLMLGVEEITGVRLETSGFLVQPNFAGLCAAVRARQAREKFDPVLAIRKSGTRPPLFCLYGYDGDVARYFYLAEALGDDQPVIGIRCPALEDFSRRPASMEAAALEIMAIIRKIQPHGIPALAGYSWSGLLAFETAQQFAKAEGIYCFAALIGTTAPMRPTTRASRVFHFVCYFFPWLWRLLADKTNFRKRVSRWREMLRDTRHNLAETSLPVDEWADNPLSAHLLRLMESYRPPLRSGMAVDVFRERKQYHLHAHPLHAWMTSHLPDGGWNHWTRFPNQIHWVEGDHEDMIKPPFVAGLAQSIRSAMNRHLQTEPPRNELAARRVHCDTGDQS